MARQADYVVGLLLPLLVLAVMLLWVLPVAVLERRAEAGGYDGRLTGLAAPISLNDKEVPLDPPRPPPWAAASPSLPMPSLFGPWRRSGTAAAPRRPPPQGEEDKRASTPVSAGTMLLPPRSPRLLPGGGDHSPPSPSLDKPGDSPPLTPDRDSGNLLGAYPPSVPNFEAGGGVLPPPFPPAPPALWKDVTAGSGLPTGRGLKFGGPALGDFDGDGFLDAALLNHHTKRAWVVLGAPSTEAEQIRFARAADVYPGHTSYLSDIHGIAVGNLRGKTVAGEAPEVAKGTEASAGLPSLLVARGGWNGQKPAVPWLLQPAADAPTAAMAAADVESVGGGWDDVAEPAGLAMVGARGRSPRLLDLDADGDLDVLLINYAGQRAASGAPTKDVQLAYENMGNGGYERRMPKHPSDAHKRQVHWVSAPAEALILTARGGDDTPPWVWRDARRRGRGNNAAAAAATAAESGTPWSPRVTFITYPWLSVWTIHNWTFADVTDTVLAAVPGGRSRLSPVAGAAEVDVDGDGRRDLVLTRFTGGLNNVILRAEANGTYTEVTDTYLPQGMRGHRGVVAGDFNNDGWEDLFLSSKEAGQPDTLLTSTGPGRPFLVSVGGHGAVPAGRSDTVGDAAAAADFNGDGILDLLVGDGDQDLSELAGSWSLFAGTPPTQGAAAAHWLHVVVGVSPVGPPAPPTGARVSVECGERLWTRRIGGGGPVFSQSADPTAYVGLGGCNGTAGVRVGVVWPTGAAAVSKGRVPVDTVVRVGGGAGEGHPAAGRRVDGEVC
ncbi:hypothetical protein MMPV_008627 [Pyropia vietnamensis]